MLLIEQKLRFFLRNLNFHMIGFYEFFLGIDFFLYGYQKLPLPLQNVMEWFGFTPWLATIVPLAELLGGSLIIISGFLKGYWGSLLTRLAALILLVYMVFAFAIAHQDWFITPRLFMSEQIFLWAISLHFLIKGKPQKD